MANEINRGPVDLLQAIFLFPKVEVEVVQKQTSEENLKSALTSGLSLLEARGERVIRMFYGIGCVPMVTGDIATEFVVKQSRIRQIKQFNLRKMQHPHSLSQLALELNEKGVCFTGLAKVLENAMGMQKAVNQKPLDSAKEQFGRDHAPTCTAEEPCPTCRLWSQLEKVGLCEQFNDLLAEWLAHDERSNGDVDLAELDLSVRTSDALRDGGLFSLDSIASQTEAGLMRIQGLGQKRLNEVKEALASHGRRLRD